MMTLGSERLPYKTNKPQVASSKPFKCDNNNQHLYKRNLLRNIHCTGAIA